MYFKDRIQFITQFRVKKVLSAQNYTFFHVHNYRVILCNAHA